MMFIKKLFFIFLYSVLFNSVLFANTCPKWFPMPSDGLVVVMPIYDKNITEPDLDCDGIIDTIDKDIDGDGVLNDFDIFPLDNSESQDNDHDGIGNNADMDDDNDGYSDLEELEKGSDPLNSNSIPLTILTRHDPHLHINCLGYVEKSGEDINGNGILEDNEITSETPVYEEGTPLTILQLKNMIENNEDVTHVNTCEITDMDSLFASNTTFNQDISQWNTGAVTTMNFMFSGAQSFNQPIGIWDMSQVTTINDMFWGAIAFNQPIGDWNTSNITNMNGVFAEAESFNQPIKNWDTSKVTYMPLMFLGATSFNQDISTWNVSKITNMFRLFYEATNFDQDISDWNVSKVIEHTEFSTDSAFQNSHNPFANKVPTVDAGDDQEVSVNSSIILTAYAADSDGTIVHYEWKEGDTLLGTTASISYTPTTLGDHNITVTVMDNSDATATISIILTAIKGIVHTIPKLSSLDKEAYLTAINNARSEAITCGDYGDFSATSPVTWNEKLYRAAYEHSQDMANTNTFSHAGSNTEYDWSRIPEGPSDMQERLDSHSYVWDVISENIAAGTSMDTAQKAINIWLTSPGHCKNIMDPNISEVGMAKVTNNSSTYHNYWTQNFAKPYIQ